MSEDLKTILRRMGTVSHHAGAFSSDVLIAVAEVLPERIRHSLETGCGKSTVMFSNISEQHYVFAYDDRGTPGSSVQMVMDDLAYQNDAVTWIYGPTQTTLPLYQFPSELLFDVILLDGPHGYPFPDLEYALLYERLRPGGVLILDDVHIPSIGRMYDILREDRMYREIGVFSTTGVLQRTSRPSVPPTGDHWYEQSYNVARFPLPMDKYVSPRLADAGEVIDLRDRRRLERHLISGGEFVSAEDGLRTTDLSTVLNFDLTNVPQDPLTVHVTHKSCSGDQKTDAVITIGADRFKLETSTEWTRSRFVMSSPPGQKLTIEFEHPSAIPENDLGHARYDFRRFGSMVRDIQIGAHDSGSTPVVTGSKIKSRPPLLKRIQSLFSRSSDAGGR